MADWILTPCNVARSWHWFCKVTAPCNVTCGSGIVTGDSEFTKWQHPAMWYVAQEWHMSLNSPKRPPYWNSTFSISTTSRSRHVILHQSPKFYPNRTTIERKKITSCRFSRWRISAVLDFRNPIMRSLKSPRTTSYRSSGTYIGSKLLSFWENRILFYFGDRQADKQTDQQMDQQMDSIDALSRSRCREQLLKWLLDYLKSSIHIPLFGFSE